MTETQRMQLLALRATLASCAAQLDALLVEPAPADGSCRHELRKDATTGGGPRMFLCLTCGAQLPGAA